MKRHVASRKKEKIQEADEILEIQSHDVTFLKSVRELWMEEKLCDVLLVVEGTTIKAHKLALAAFSDHFRELFVSHENEAYSSDLSRIPLLGVGRGTINRLLEAIYNGKIRINPSTVGDVLSAASYLRMKGVLDAIEKYLCSLLSAENSLKTIQMAHVHSLWNLAEEAYKISCANFSTISKQKGFLKLRYSELISMLRRQDLVVDSEIEVFNAVTKWIEADRTSRRPYAGRIMRHIRFSLMNESQLIDNVEGSAIVSEVPEVREYVREAVRFHLLPYRRSICQNERCVPRTAIQVDAIVACGGLPGKEVGATTDSMFYYTAGSTKWIPFNKLPLPLHHHAVAVLGGYLYVAGGNHGDGNNSPSQMVWRFDPWNEEWLQCSSMIEARQCFQLGILNNQIYAVGGKGYEDETLRDVERYNPSDDSWTKVVPISSARRYVAVAVLESRLYAVGGSRNDMISKRVERYHPVTSIWERCRSISSPRFSAFLHASNDKLWLIGGATVRNKGPAGVVGATKIEVYTPTADQWTTVAGCTAHGDYEDIAPASAAAYMNDFGSEAGSCSMNDKVYFVGGYSWQKRARVDACQTLDLTAEDKVQHPSKTKLPTIALEQSDCATGAEYSSDNAHNAATERTFLPCYPMHCTGVACAALTLRKIPSIKREEDSTAGMVALSGSRKASECQPEHTTPMPSVVQTPSLRYRVPSRTKLAPIRPVQRTANCSREFRTSTLKKDMTPATPRPTSTITRSRDMTLPFKRNTAVDRTSLVEAAQSTEIDTAVTMREPTGELDAAPQERPGSVISGISSDREHSTEDDDSMEIYRAIGQTLSEFLCP